MIVALAGGVGGAKLADGLAAVLGGDLSVVVNTGDDFEHFGLAVSPDLDTIMYTLAGIANPETGWGISGETWNFLDLATRLGGPAWFRIGDRDLATHVLRSERLRRGERLTLITADPLPRSKRRRARSCKGSPTTKRSSRRIALVGDAAFVVRPHTGMGIAKAAADAIALRKHLSSAPLGDALRGYRQERVQAGTAIAASGRELGAHLM
jgi:hypothetical protein